MHYRLSGIPLTDLVYIIRISIDLDNLSLVDTVRSTTGEYEWTDTSGIGIRYFCCLKAGIRDAPPLETMGQSPFKDFVFHDPRNLPFSTDFLIIAHDSLWKQAQDLARHKKNILRFSNPAVVLISDVYNQFSGGNVDPAALRNCIAWTRSNGGDALQSVVLMGGGHYDYKMIKAAKPNLIPVAEIGDACFEDFFGITHGGEDVSDPNAAPDIPIGRLPCYYVQEAAAMVSKIIEMENPDSAQLGAWRNRMLFVADDDMQGKTPDSPDHLNYSEDLAREAAGLRPSLDIRKVYEIAYEANSQGEKPEAAQAIYNDFQDGLAFVNYFGHGGRIVWADEHVLLPENVARMTNKWQYPLVSSFSCNVGQFDMPDSTRSLSEYLMLRENGGACAAVAAARLSNAPPNKALAMNFYRFAFDTSSAAPQSAGEAFILAKQIVKDVNQKAYVFFGDPSLSCGRPGRRIDLRVSNAAGAAIDTLKAFQQVTVSGAVRDPATGQPDGSFGSGGGQAFVYILLVNPPEDVTKVGKVSGFTMNYSMPGSPVVVGQAPVKNGRFSQQFLLPKTLIFGKPDARLTAYAWRGVDAATGIDTSLLFSGYDTTAFKDSIGPTIAVMLVYTDPASSKGTAPQTGIAFTDKITCHLPFTFEISVSDSNGVNVTGTGPDEGLTFELPGVIARQNINDKFQFKQGDFRAGTATLGFDESQIRPGAYTMNLSAQDMLGNLSKKTIQLTVTASLDLSMSHVFNYPNPMRLGGTTRFYYDLSMTDFSAYNASETPRVTIRLYTMSGRLIRVFPYASRGEVFDGRDQFGNTLSPGVYLYQVIVEDRSQQNK